MKYAMGGIGDCLQVLEDAIKEKEIYLFSHCIDAPQIFDKFGVDVTFHYYSSSDELQSVYQIISLKNLLPLERKKYLNVPIPSPPKLELKNRVIGLHTLGSTFSHVYWQQRGQPSKTLNRGFISEFCSKLDDGNTTILLFCSPNDKPIYKKLIEYEGLKNVQIIAYYSLWDSLSSVTYCHKVVGVDSAIKTMSSMLKIPTICLVGDYEDKFRDENFIEPYVNDNIMKVIKFKEIGPEELKKTIDLINENN